MHGPASGNAEAGHRRLVRSYERSSVAVSQMDPRLFVARSEEMTRILGMWEGGSRQPIMVEGPAGIGKTALVKAVATEVARQGAAVAYTRPQYPEAAETLLQRGRDRRSLFVLDGIDEDWVTSASLVRHIQASRRNMMVLTTAREAEPRRTETVFGNHTVAWIRLDGLNHAALDALIAARAPRLPVADRRQLVELSQRSPLAAELLARLAEQDSVESIVRRLQENPTRYAGVFGPEFSGLRVDAPLLPPRPGDELDVRVRAFSQDLIRELAAHPELMRELRPRQFEELMAELYTRQGFEVELTPETRDGGIDLYVVRHEAFGPVVTLVDVKRYKETHRVGVGVVRQLYGVVEAKGANAGVVATTSFFSRDAQRFTENVALRMRLQNFLDVRDMLRAVAIKP